VEIIMRSILLPLLGLVVSIAAHAQSSEIPNRPIAELALSNDTMQVRYASSGGAVGVERSKFSGTFFLSEERDIVLSAGLLFPTNLELGRLSIMV